MSVSEVAKVTLCQSDELPERGRLVLDVGDITIGLFRLRGTVHAYENRCPHMGGPVCQGLLIPGVRELVGEQGETLGHAFDEHDLHVVCPWHGYEYSIETGRHAGTGRPRLRSMPVKEVDGVIYGEF
jgi:nitrite reductase/ring-hydroxylating ferredoxin subunit